MNLVMLLLITTATFLVNTVSSRRLPEGNALDVDLRQGWGSPGWGPGQGWGHDWGQGGMNPGLPWKPNMGPGQAWGPGMQPGQGWGPGWGPGMNPGQGWKPSPNGWMGPTAWQPNNPSTVPDEGVSADSVSTSESDSGATFSIPSDAETTTA